MPEEELNNLARIGQLEKVPYSKQLMQKMLATARTILGQPSVLLLDEPVEGLAPVICDMLMEAFGRLAASGVMQPRDRHEGTSRPAGHDLIDGHQRGFDQLLAAYGLHTDLGHVAPLLRPADGRSTSVGLRASLFCFD